MRGFAGCRSTAAPAPGRETVDAMAATMQLPDDAEPVEFIGQPVDGTDRATDQGGQAGVGSGSSFRSNAGAACDRAALPSARRKRPV